MIMDANKAKELLRDSMAFPKEMTREDVMTRSEWEDVYYYIEHRIGKALLKGEYNIQIYTSRILDNINSMKNYSEQHPRTAFVENAIKEDYESKGWVVKLKYNGYYSSITFKLPLTLKQRLSILIRGYLD